MLLQFSGLEFRAGPALSHTRGFAHIEVLPESQEDKGSSLEQVLGLTVRLWELARPSFLTELYLFICS